MSDGPFAALGVGDDLEFHASKEPKSRRPWVDGVKYVPYLFVMKFELLVACLFSSSLAFGQFIPQPMGYNPDANSDGFIGVDDVLETLVLFGNAFENGDSTDIFVVNFVGQEDSTFVIPESTDICYFEWLPEFLDIPAEDNPYCINPAQMKCVLPAGNTLKFMSVMMKMGWKVNDTSTPYPSWNINPSTNCYSGELSFEALVWRRYGPNILDDNAFGFGWTGQYGLVTSSIFVRHLDGTWHVMFEE